MVMGNLLISSQIITIQQDLTDIEFHLSLTAWQLILINKVFCSISRYQFGDLWEPGYSPQPANVRKCTRVTVFAYLQSFNDNLKGRFSALRFRS